MHYTYEPMPYGRRRTTKPRVMRKRQKAKGIAKRTRYPRRKSYSKAITLRPKWTPAISHKAYVKFVYCDSSFSRTLNVAGAYSAYYVFRGNSPYDPDYTGVGVQPYGWDDYMASDKFVNFICPASSIKVYFRPEETYASIRRLHAHVIPMRANNPITTDISDVRMIPYNKGTTYDGNTESTKGAKLSHYCSTSKLLTTSLNDGAREGSYAGNPSNNGSWYWIVHFYTDVYDDEEVDIYFDVKIKYYTKINRNLQPNES